MKYGGDKDQEMYGIGGKIIFKDEVYAIQGAVFDVYREMGSGFLEAVYQECLEREMRAREIPFVPQKELT